MTTARTAAQQPLRLRNGCAFTRLRIGLGFAKCRGSFTVLDDSDAGELPRRRWVLCAALAAVLLAAVGAWGQSGDVASGAQASSQTASQTGSSAKRLKDLSLEELGKVEVVTYSKVPSQLLQTPAAVYVITSDDILRSGATTIADALRLAPGVEVGRMDSDSWAVGIRGLENNFSKSVLVLIDGRNVYTPLFAGVYWDVQDMPLEDIDRIEVIRGPGGTIWGPNAGNGVINIITKKASETQGVMANGLVGGQDQTIDDLQVGATTGRQLSFRVFGRGFERAHEYHTDGINEDAWHQERVGFRADYGNGRDNFQAEGDAYRGDSPRIVGTTPLYDETSGGDVNVRWERQLSDSAGFYVQAYFDRTLRTDSVFFGETRNMIDIDFIHHFNIPGHQQFSYGGGLRWSPYTTIAAIPGANLLAPQSGTDHVHTGFVQDEVRLGAQVSVTGGAKLQENNFNGFDVQPSVRLLWTAGEHQSVWGGITRAITTPSDLEEKFFLQGPEGPSTYIQVLGNKNFKSEDVIGYEAGYRLLASDRFYFDLSPFWNQYSKLQSFSAPAVSSSGGNTYITILYENQIAGHTTGFEFAPKVAIARWWQLNSSYSFVSSTFSANGPTSNISSTGSVPTYEGSTPRHIVSLQSKIDLPAGFQFDQMFRYASDLPAQKVKAYETMDLRAAKAFGHGFLFEAVGQNLFQPHHYEWGTGDPTQPLVGIYRAGYIQLSFNAHRQRSH
jgi:iron complex outermembrane receptor protein